MDHTKAPSKRQMQVAEQIRFAMANLFQEMDFVNEELDGIRPTVIDVSISPDLKNATVYIRMMNQDDNRSDNEALKAMNNHAGWFRKQISDQLYLKHTPKIKFQIDTVADHAQKIEDIIGTIKYSTE